jgi:hypothetical protein
LIVIETIVRFFIGVASNKRIPLWHDTSDATCGAGSSDSVRDCGRQPHEMHVETQLDQSCR